LAGWLLALVVRAAIGGTDLDSAGAVFGVSPIAHKRRRRVVFIIDEAHLLAPDQLEELRLLS
jgi:hypothetical protein